MQRGLESLRDRARYEEASAAEIEQLRCLLDKQTHTKYPFHERRVLFFPVSGSLESEVDTKIILEKRVFSFFTVKCCV